VEETAEQIASVDSGRLIFADDSQSHIVRWRFKPQRPMRAMGVVVRHAVVAPSTTGREDRSG
jgi:hypothetical protein